MSRFRDVSALRFGRLIAIERVDRPGKKTTWRCSCDCGNEALVTLSGLATKRTRSCGCLSDESRRGTKNLKHGRADTPEHRAWIGMRQRSLNKNDKSYAMYGGKGVSVCKRWLNSFENFYKDMGPKPSKTHSLDRIDVNGNYEPSNCRWATAKQQMRNRTVSLPRPVISVIELISEHQNVSYSTAYKRLRRISRWLIKQH